MPHVMIDLADPASPEAVQLIERLDIYQTALYPAESNHLLSIEDLRQPSVVFLMARVNGRAAGCGAYVNLDNEYSEIKRMFVLPEYRGMKIGRLILDRLEALAREAGLQVMRLETGVSQPEAIHLYQKAGYQKREPFGSYPNDPLCVFMEKRL
jgi:putative acetyltransferase